MASTRTIAELADRKAELLDELSAVNAEIKSRAGEHADDADEFDAESAELETTTDNRAENVESTSTTP
ncbi:hypothetical protein AAV95_02630 [Mycolicibacterium elephantis]|uniref:hypothetical protein n=1 Tax=Mycolicibacterium elephantis TaxID=81858 RepID=UPI0006295228|nr:hypothetical protein [Mycolicibacterium elephantis]KKW66350.1 hypothetical protein AAV95_02630 [Mycolicibacterium elephantis]